MKNKYNHGSLKKWMLPEHSLTAKNNLSQNFPKVSLTSSQKETIDALTKEYKEKGYVEGKKLGLQEMLNQKKALTELVSEFKQYQDSCDKVLEAEIVSIVENICKSILNIELSDKYNLQQLVSDGILSFKNHQQKFTISMNAATHLLLADLEIPEIQTKFQVDPVMDDYAFKIENNEQIICFSIDKVIQQYIISPK